ncbi:polysaccharide biosynthesis tyrosine autokinase [Vibrio breoganii]
MTQANSSITPQPAQPDVIDLGKLFGLLLDGKWVIVVTTVLFSVLGLAYALQSTPIYKADALVQVEKKTGGFPGLSADVGDMFEQDSSISAEIEIIKSRTLLAKTVDKFELTTVVAPKYLPIIGKLYARTLGQEGKIKVERFEVPIGYATSGYQIVLEDAELGKYKVIDNNENLILEGVVDTLAQNSNGFQLFVSQIGGSEGQAFYLGKRSTLSAIGWLQGSLAITEKGRQSGVLSFEFNGANPEQISLLLNDITQNYFLQNVERNAAQAENSLEFLQSKLPEVKAQLTEYENRLNTYQADNDSVDLGMEAQSTLNIMVALEAQLNELSFKESEILERFTTNHPAYISLQNKRKTLEQQKYRLEQQIKALPATQREILRLKRDVEVNQQIYLQLLNKNQELNLVKASTVGNVRILDSAVTYGGAVKPKKSLIVLLATVLGFILGVGYILIKALLHRGVESADKIEEIGIPVYSTIPKSDSQERLGKKLAQFIKRKSKAPVEEFLLSQVDPTDVSIEALRSLRTSLHFAMLEAKNNLIMISGPSPSIGKSFVSANFAAVLAQGGKKVLLIDADLRKGHIGKAAKLQHTKGLSDYLAGTDETDTFINKDVIEGLDFLGKGSVPPNPSELLLHERFDALCKWASENYDIVVIDTPPVLAVTDAAIVGQKCGTSLMVARFGQTALKEIEISSSRLEQSGVSVKGVVLNAVEKTASSYYSYGYYNYSYKND